MARFYIFYIQKVRPRGEMKWVLNIDDDLDDRELFCEALSEIDSSLQCIAASSAEEALQLLKNRDLPPSWIFVDINMPRIGGLECIQLLRKNDRLKNIPITVLSTTSDPADIRLIRQAGVDFIRKESSYRLYVTNLKEKLGTLAVTEN